MIRAEKEAPTARTEEAVSKIALRPSDASMPDNKYKKLLSDTAILGIGTFGSKIIVFLLMPLYTRFLSTAQYSDADLITQTANLLLPLVSVGICEAIFRFTLDKSYSKEEVFSSGLAVICTGGGIFLLLSPLLSHISYFGEYTALICTFVIASCYHSLCAQFVRARGQTKLFASQGIAGTMTTIILNIIFLVGFNMGVTGYVLSVVISDILISVVLTFPFGLYHMIGFRHINRNTISSMLRFSIPLIPTTIFWWITNVADRYMVKEIIGSDVNGLYAAAYKIPTLLILLSSVFIEAWQFSAVSQKDSSDAISFFGIVFESFQGVLFMAAGVLIAFAKVVTVIFLAPEYYASWSYMPILIAATVYSSLVTFMGSIYLVNKKSILSFLTAFVGASSNILLNALLIPTPLGANGAAIATFMSYFVVFIIRAANSRRSIPFDLHIGKLILNTAIIFMQTATILLDFTFWIPCQIVGVALIFVINAGPIIEGVKKLLHRGIGVK